MHDLRFAFRQLLKNPGFTVAAVLMLALGIGANTAIFSLIDHVMLRFLPVRDPEELLVVPGPLSYPRYERIRDQNGVFTEIFGTHLLPGMAVSIAGQPAGQASGELVSGSYFATLGVRAALGRTLRPEDDLSPESSPVAVISHAFWKRAFGGVADVLGKTIQVRSKPGYASTSGLDIYDGAAARNREGAVLTIVGVAPPEFFGETVGTATDVWIPMMMEPGVMPGRPWLTKDNVAWVTIMGRKKPGTSSEQTSAALTLLWRQMLTEEAGADRTAETMRSIGQMQLKVESGGKGFSQLRRQFSQPLQILMAVVGLVLFIACLNVANLLMARGTARQRELGVRLALGAGHGRLIRQLLTESLLLGVLGGLLGALIAFAGTRMLVALVSSGYETIHLPLQPDLRTLGFAAVISLGTTVLFGLAPAVRATHVRLADTLKNTARSMAKFYFPTGNAIGKHLVTRIEGKPLQLEIVGVARDVQDHNFWAEPVRRFYVSCFQPIDGITEANFAIRTVGNPANFATTLRREVEAVDRNLMILGISEVTSLMHQSLVQERLIAGLSAFFGLLAVTLAGIGLYGVMAYDVVQRTSEIGIRMALGAQRSAVLKLILANGLRLTLLGVAVGLGGAAALTRLIKSQLHGVKAIDPLTFIVVVSGLVVVTVFACWLPARRATKIEPIQALRHE